MKVDEGQNSSILLTALSARAFACSSFLLFDGAPATLGLESFSVTVRLKTKDDVAGASLLGCVGGVAVGSMLSLSTTKNPRRSN
jgi:hypothetical protein